MHESPAAAEFLPASREEVRARGWSGLDVLLVTGDAYLDHPSHGAAVIGRVLEAAGFKVGIVARPDWRSAADFAALGRPALFAGVTAGAVDSRQAGFTAEGRPRRSDPCASGGRGPGRPELATLVYANRVREAFPGLPVVLGGIEASCRRFSYLDDRTGAVRRSLLVDSRAELLVFGPGEAAAVEVALRLASGRDLRGIPGTARLLRRGEERPAGDLVELPEHGAVAADPALLLEVARALEQAGGPGRSVRLSQRYEEGTVLAEPRARMTTEGLDAISALPFLRAAHPACGGPLPALETVRWSVISHRGCPGGCSFCALALHQGREVVARSKGSILDEIRELASRPGFRGTISDVGGPTANAWAVRRKDEARCRDCRLASCLYPGICDNLEPRHDALLGLLGDAAGVPGVRRVLLASGVRHDLAIGERGFVEAVARHHTGGHLKLAPEHVDRDVLALMRKPPIEAFEEFEARFREASRAAGKRQYVVPYFIAGFPGCDPAAAERVSAWLARRGQRLRQVQTFVPIPGTRAAALFAAGRDDKGRAVFVPDPRERRRQKQLLTDPAPPKRPGHRPRRRG
jgi:uncharacterized radical SAM protein YgiQ